MKEISRSYQIEPDRDYLSPIIEVFLVGKNNRVPLNVLVDSGAAKAIFPKHSANSAGISLENAPAEFVIWGGSTVIGNKVKCYIDIDEETFKIDVIFVEKLSYPYGLLGRIPLFSKFNEVTFLENTSNPRVEFRY